uniref:Uncharacterized protein n=1 Tax=Aegilops tauschii subsp. strangulata TaxID=200361 RepID=A0A453QXH2_AEGTS
MWFVVSRFLDQLGMSAKFDTKSYCRQSFIGGNYGLLNTTTFQPNPDYYSALLWHRLMGTKVLEAKFTGSNMVRAYAHCAKHAVSDPDDPTTPSHHHSNIDRLIIH